MGESIISIRALSSRGPWAIPRPLLALLALGSCLSLAGCETEGVTPDCPSIPAGGAGAISEWRQKAQSQPGPCATPSIDDMLKDAAGANGE